MSVISLEELRSNREKRLASQSQSKQSTTSDKHGLTLTDFELSEMTGQDIDHLISFFIVLDRACRDPFKLKSNFARKAAVYVATSASLGYITNQIDHESFGSNWNISPIGFDFLGELDEILRDIAVKIDPDTFS
jgi:hypothetical protein